MPPRTVFLYAFVQIEGYAPVNRIETVKSDKLFENPQGFIIRERCALFLSDFRKRKEIFI